MIPIKRKENMNNTKLIYPSVVLLQTGEIVNKEETSKAYIGCQRSAQVENIPHGTYDPTIWFQF